MEPYPCHLLHMATRSRCKKIWELPDEIFLKIFSYFPKRTLSQTAQVSKRFQRISYDATLWKSVHFKNEILGPDTLGFVLSRGTKKLNILDCQFLKPVFLNDEFQESCELRSLSFADYCSHRGDDKYSGGLHPLLRRCRQLTAIDLTVVSELVNDDFCRAIAENSNLQTIRFMTVELIFSGVLAIAKGCQRLRIWEYFGTEIFMTELELHTLLEVLAVSIQSIYIFRHTRFLLDEHVAKLVKKCPNITLLHLEGCQKITAETIRHLCTLQKLEYLNVSRCHGITAKSLCQLRHVRSLKWLVAFDVVPRLEDRIVVQTSLTSVVVDLYTLVMTDSDYDDIAM